MLDNILSTISNSSYNKATFVHLMPFEKSNGSLQYGINGTSHEPTDVIITPNSIHFTHSVIKHAYETGFKVQSPLKAYTSKLAITPFEFPQVTAVKQELIQFQTRLNFIFGWRLALGLTKNDLLFVYWFFCPVLSQANRPIVFASNTTLAHTSAGAS